MEKTTFPTKVEIHHKGFPFLAGVPRTSPRAQPSARSPMAWAQGNAHLGAGPSRDAASWMCMVQTGKNRFQGQTTLSSEVPAVAFVFFCI